MSFWVWVLIIVLLVLLLTVHASHELLARQLKDPQGEATAPWAVASIALMLLRLATDVNAAGQQENEQNDDQNPNPERHPSPPISE